jgi:1-acyl-sn-glycerol-3-phosphate acyltransferase
MLRVYRVLAIVLHILFGMGVLVFFQVREPIAPARWQRQARITQWWHRRVCRIFGLRVQVQGTPVPGAALLAANHISWIDIMVIGAARPANFVAKREVANWPVVGWLVARSGTVFIQRGGDASEVAEQMTRRIQQGQTLVIFPEGTTSDGTSLRPFHPRLYQAAIRAECPVQPVALRYIEPAGQPPRLPFIGDETFAAHLWRLSAQRNTVVELSFLAPVPSAGQPRRALADATRAQIHLTLFGVLVAIPPQAAAPVEEQTEVP